MRMPPPEWLTKKLAKVELIAIRIPSNANYAFQGNFTVTLIEGDGIGPEISKAVKDIFTAAGAPIKWEPVDVTPRLKDGRTVIPDEAIDSVTKNYVALKGPLAVSLAPQILHRAHYLHI